MRIDGAAQAVWQSFQVIYEAALTEEAKNVDTTPSWGSWLWDQLPSPFESATIPTSARALRAQSAWMAYWDARTGPGLKAPASSDLYVSGVLFADRYGIRGPFVEELRVFAGSNPARAADLAVDRPLLERLSDPKTEWDRQVDRALQALRNATTGVGIGLGVAFGVLALVALATQEKR